MKANVLKAGFWQGTAVLPTTNGEQDSPTANPVLPSLEHVVKDLRHLSIDTDRIREVAHELDDEQLGTRKDDWWQGPVFLEEDSERTIQFFMVANTLNFKYWDSDDPGQKYETEYQGVTWSGAYGMFAALARALDEGRDILDAEYLAGLTDDEAEDIFRGTIPMPMVKERAAILRETGQVLRDKYNGSFTNLIERSDHRAFDHGNGIVDRLARDFPSYSDTSPYMDREVVFHKRAQLAVGMLYNRLKGGDLFEVEDVDELTVFADYQLPRALRSLGILKYSDELARKVDGRELIPRDSPEEVELRAATVYAADLLLKEVNATRAEEGNEAVSVLNIDYCLWLAGRDAPEDQYHHLTETTAY